jgi:hypothetical protein
MKMSEDSIINILLKEAEALSLPCFDLAPADKGDKIAAYWKGRRSDLPEQYPKSVTAFKSQKHYLSVDDNLFKKIGLQGRGPFVLSMLTTMEGSEKLLQVNSPMKNIHKISFTDSIPLTAIPAISPPPLEAILLYGGPSVQQFLTTQKLQRWEYDKVNDEIQKQYLKYFNPQLPLCMKKPPFARIGGWHIQWPDDDFYIPREMRLMLWTFQEAEPWYEVFLSPLRNCVIKKRIT